MENFHKLLYIRATFLVSNQENVPLHLDFNFLLGLLEVLPEVLNRMNRSFVNKKSLLLEKFRISALRSQCSNNLAQILFHFIEYILKPQAYHQYTLIVLSWYES
jgi:hypothetical protein